MTTNYDLIADQYQRAKLHPWRAHVEAFTFWEVVGDLGGQQVMDLACGEGFYTRQLRARGAAKVTGVDLSAGMIALARQQEAERPLNIHYAVGDARDVLPDEPCDLVVAAYLLNYAATRTQLAAMLRGAARCLKPGGRFVTINGNPACHFPSAPSFRKYGFETSVPGEWHEGATIKWLLHLEDGPIEIENYHLTAATHEEECRAAGFDAIRWHPPRLSPQGAAAFAPGYWDDLLARPPLTCLECVRSPAPAAA